MKYMYTYVNVHVVALPNYMLLASGRLCKQLIFIVASNIEFYNGALQYIKVRVPRARV